MVEARLWRCACALPHGGGRENTAAGHRHTHTARHRRQSQRCRVRGLWFGLDSARQTPRPHQTPRPQRRTLTHWVWRPGRSWTRTTARAARATLETPTLAYPCAARRYQALVETPKNVEIMEVEKKKNKLTAPRVSGFVTALVS